MSDEQTPNPNLADIEAQRQALAAAEAQILEPIYTKLQELLTEAQPLISAVQSETAKLGAAQDSIKLTANNLGNQLKRLSGSVDRALREL